MRYLYSALLYILFPFVLLRMLWRSRRAPEYRRRLRERFGVFATDFDPARPSLWLHAVSVGEVLAATSFIEELLRDYPEHRLVVTTTTPTGSQRVQALFGERVFHVYAPWDLPGSVRRFLRRIRPELVLLMETELWPNLIHRSRAQGAKVILVNARMSARSARRYARLGRLRRGMLAQLDRVACQSQADAGRLLSLGVPEAALTVTGNLKFDLQLDDAARARVARLRQRFGSDRRPVLLAASTHPGEEQLVLKAFSALRKSHDNCLLVLVPRHPERFDSVHTLCSEKGWQVVRLSASRRPGEWDDIVLGDSMGDLAVLYGTAWIAFIGGSFVEHGGHNALEAAAWGVPVVSGPHTFNFSAITDLLTAADAMLVLEEPAQLAACLNALLKDAVRRQHMGVAGQQVVADNRGARRQLMQLVAQELGHPGG